MAAKKKRKKKGRQQRQRSKVTPSTHQTSMRRAGAAFGEAAWRKTSDCAVAWEHYSKILSYELWLAEGATAPPPEHGDLPESYFAALERWPDAFDYVRHHMFMYVGGALGHVPWAEMLLSLVHRAVEQEPGSGQELTEALRSAHDRFLRQYQAAIQSTVSAARAESQVERLRAGLHGWAAIYETDFPLWFMGVLGNTLRSGRFDFSYLGGPGTRVAQASLVNTVRKNLAGTPIEALVNDVYVPLLRNVINHNDYEFVDTPDGIILRDHDTGTEWTEDFLWQVILASQKMLQSILVATQVVQATLPDETNDWADCGVMNMSYGATAEDLPVVVVAQLWCFRDIDPMGTWLERATLRVSAEEGDMESVTLTPRARLTGEPISSRPFGQAVRKHHWAWVVRLPVAPAIGLGLPEVTTAEGERFEVVAPADRHLLPASLANDV